MLVRLGLFVRKTTRSIHVPIYCRLYLGREWGCYKRIVRPRLYIAGRGHATSSMPFQTFFHSMPGMQRFFYKSLQYQFSPLPITLTCALGSDRRLNACTVAMQRN